MNSDMARGGCLFWLGVGFGLLFALLLQGERVRSKSALHITGGKSQLEQGSKALIRLSVPVYGAAEQRVNLYKLVE